MWMVYKRVFKRAAGDDKYCCTFNLDLHAQSDSTNNFGQKAFFLLKNFEENFRWFRKITFCGLLTSYLADKDECRGSASSWYSLATRSIKKLLSAILMWASCSWNEYHSLFFPKTLFSGSPHFHHFSSSFYSWTMSSFGGFDRVRKAF
jgi:hypothetical protein